MELLNKFRGNNKFSQFGEDGIISALLDIIPDKNNWCCEFGAWDGKHLSNTWNLIEKGYSAILIECDKEKHKELQKNCTPYIEQGVIPINKKVEIEGDDSLDNILSNTPIPYDFDLLSIDIDGDDYYIADSIKNYKPKVMLIEYNVSIIKGTLFIQPQGSNIGSSFDSIVIMMMGKGYDLIATTQSNLIFIDKKYREYYKDYFFNSYDILDFRGGTCIIQGQDGQLYYTGGKKSFWGKENKFSKLMNSIKEI